jgi:hypothetical protein
MLPLDLLEELVDGIGNVKIRDFDVRRKVEQQEEIRFGPVPRQRIGGVDGAQILVGGDAIMSGKRFRLLALEETFQFPRYGFPIAFHERLVQDIHFQFPVHDHTLRAYTG